MISLSSNQFAYQALRDIGCLRPGQTTSPDVLSDIFAALNQMMDSWQLNGLLVQAIRSDLYTLTAGLQTYTIGPTGATFTAPRPTFIERANIVLNTVSPTVRRMLNIYNVDQWAAIRVQQVQNAIPIDLYYVRDFDPTNGFGSLLLWPGPVSAYQLELFTWQQLQQFAAETTVYNFPPGYAKAIEKNLAVEIAPMMEIYSKLGACAHPRQDRLELVITQAREAKGDLESYNAPDPIMHCDPAFSSAMRSGGGFNYAIGE